MHMLQAVGPEPDLEGGARQLPEPGAAAEPAAGGQPPGVCAHGGAVLSDTARGTVSNDTGPIMYLLTLFQVYPSTGVSHNYPLPPHLDLLSTNNLPSHLLLW